MHNILVIGSGGREHALCWGFKSDPRVHHVYAAPGNPGIARDATCVNISWQDVDALSDFCLQNDIGFIFVGPEAPLSAGLVNDMRKRGQVKCFGPTAEAAQLESSKGFTKDLCRAHSIPTAAYERVFSMEQALACSLLQTFPVVIKQDGLAAGKGVVIAQTRQEALEFLEAFLNNASGAGVVVEEFLQGREASFFVVCHEEQCIPLGFWHDHKRVGDGDVGPNTGGMGAYGPSPLSSSALEKEVMDTIIKPTLQAMKERGTPFSGVLYAGLMLTKQGPKLIEYNVRFGDPETQALIPCVQASLLDLFWPQAGEVPQSIWKPHVKAVTVVMANKGYPAALELSEKPISGLEEAAALPGVHIFHAGTSYNEQSEVVATGGRVLAVTGVGPTVEEARERAYKAVDMIAWPGCFCRRDIAKNVAVTAPAEA